MENILNNETDDELEEDNTNKKEKVIDYEYR